MADAESAGPLTYAMRPRRLRTECQLFVIASLRHK